ncbi:hypothetical protein Godav_001010 [Gossypium davidsonii]|uniref:Uncharacterized protein n=2 Tax=Gossypium TaxID=3633 RepID=A0A7J8T1I6_GOSDV|nr:hypothetical protein [Gossypium davidsonii]MBA0667989.1 hypothetical protein [Gossypium klotzschianum]
MERTNFENMHMSNLIASASNEKNGELKSRSQHWSQIE